MKLDDLKTLRTAAPALLPPQSISEEILLEKYAKGDEQTISFPPISDQPASAKSLKLSAASSAGAAVHYYIREGPAEVSDDGTITFTPIPPRAKFPVKVTVVSWQWGRSIEPKLKSAEPVEQTFHLTREPSR